MGDWKSVDEVLEYAIGKEEEAIRFYTDLAERVTVPGMKEVLQQFAL
ncbi:MAG: ferritin family protein [bacterium]